MDKKQGDLLAWLAELPRLRSQQWKRWPFHWFSGTPDSIWRDDIKARNGSYVKRETVEANLRRKAEVLKEDLERINGWFERYEAYKKEYIESEEDCCMCTGDQEWQVKTKGLERSRLI